MTTVNFSKEDFPFLQSSDALCIGRTTIGVNELEHEAEALMSLCAMAGTPLSGEVNYDELLTVEAVSGEDGDVYLSTIYAPAIWWFKPTEEGDTTPEQPVLRVGSNLFPVEVKNGVFTCGQFVANNSDGEISIEINENLEKENYLSAVVYFSIPGTDDLLEIGLRLDPEKCATKTKEDCIALRKKLIGSFKTGAMGDFLRVSGQGGSSTINMQELGIGQWRVESITELELIDSTTQKPRTAHTLQLATGESVWSKGNVASILADPKRAWENSLLAKGEATKQTENLPGEKVRAVLHLKAEYTLQIGKIEERGKGYSVSCKLRKGLPLLASAGEATMQPVKQLAAAVAGDVSSEQQAELLGSWK